MKIIPSKGANATLVLSLAAFGTVLSIAFAHPSEKETAPLIEKKKVTPPLKGVDIVYTTYRVSADQPSSITYKTGSVINIPAGAFADSKGKPVTGTVELRYREFHDPADFFISGIPMTYDSAGTTYHFESAGMLEIQAFQDGKPLYASDRKIEVKLHSEQTEDRYNIYRFDPTAGKWDFVSRDKALPVEQMEETEEMAAAPFLLNVPVTQQLLDAEKATALVKPTLFDKEKYQFDLDVDPAEFPELAVYKELLFETNDTKPDFDHYYAGSTWNDIQLEKNDKGSYLMTLSKGREQHTFTVRPVFDSAGYKAAYETYLTLLRDRRNKESATNKTADSIHRVLTKGQKFQADLAKNRKANALAQFEKQEVVARTFIISGFGIWNSDCPARLPQGEQFAATYVDSTGKKLAFKTLYLVEKGRNAMFMITSYSRLYYNPTKDNLLWAVTNDNKLAILSEKDFKRLKKVNDSCTVVMTLNDKPVTKSYEVKQILRF